MPGQAYDRDRAPLRGPLPARRGSAAKRALHRPAVVGAPGEAAAAETARLRRIPEEGGGLVGQVRGVGDGPRRPARESRPRSTRKFPIPGPEQDRLAERSAASTGVWPSVWGARLLPTKTRSASWSSSAARPSCRRPRRRRPGRRAPRAHVKREARRPSSLSISARRSACLGTMRREQRDAARARGQEGADKRRLLAGPRRRSEEDQPPSGGRGPSRSARPGRLVQAGIVDVELDVARDRDPVRRIPERAEALGVLRRAARSRRSRRARTPRPAETPSGARSSCPRSSR
jgi:hypothetical protein